MKHEHCHRKHCHCFECAPTTKRGAITIKNKLEIKLGGKVLIPGMEPISSLTDMALAKYVRGHCAMIHYKEVLRLIPGSKVIRILYPQGNASTGMFIELPEGPPPAGDHCPPGSYPDWYAVLRCHCHEEKYEEEPECAGFNFSGCQNEYNPDNHPKDPEMHPNSPYLKI